MFRELRRKEKQLSTDECNEILSIAEWGTLATMGDDEYPYAVPVNFVYHNGTIYFHCATTGHKLDNIRYRPNVSFSVVTDIFAVPIISRSDSADSPSVFKGFDTNFNSVTVFGKAAEVFESEKIEGLYALFKKFIAHEDYDRFKDNGSLYIEKNLSRTTLIKIEIIHMTGKKGIK